MTTLRNCLFPSFPGGRVGAGLLIVRLVFGIGLALHGWSKLQSPNGPSGWMNKPGEPSPVPGFLQAMAVTAEFGGGLALAAGLLTPLAATLVVINMTTAYLMVHRNDPFVGGPGEKSSELAVAYLAIGLLLALCGPGAFSVDRLMWMRPARAPSVRGVTASGG